VVNDDLIARARALVAASEDVVLALDPDRRLLAASEAARDRLPGLVEGRTVPEGLLRAGAGVAPLTLYLGDPGPLSAYEELRAGFTAAVSHELRTPLARLLVLLESVELPGARVAEIVEQARQEVAQARELIDDVLFLGELETGAEVVALGKTQAMPVLREVVEELSERAARAGMRIEVEGNGSVELPLRPRMLRVLAENLAENALRYAGEGSAFRFRLALLNDQVVLTAVDDGAGVSEEDLPRLFERFYRADRARSSRGTGLGLAIVKHVVGAAGGHVEALGGPGRGLQIRCVFPN
jgi:two-component system phosphate regulon sensor histidine kinase PhoR